MPAANQPGNDAVKTASGGSARLTGSWNKICKRLSKQVVKVTTIKSWSAEFKNIIIYLCSPHSYKNNSKTCND